MYFLKNILFKAFKLLDDIEPILFIYNGTKIVGFFTYVLLCLTFLKNEY
jgi:hypothetical protein